MLGENLGGFGGYGQSTKLYTHQHFVVPCKLVPLQINWALIKIASMTL